MDNRRLLLAAVLSMVIVIGWQYLFPPPEPAPAIPSSVDAAASAVPSAVPASSAAPSDSAGAIGIPPSALPASEEESVAVAAEERRVLENDEVRAELTNRGGELASFRLKRITDRGAPVELVRSRVEGPLPFAVVDSLAVPLPVSAALHRVTEDRDEHGNPRLSFDYRGPAGYSRKVFTLTPKGTLLAKVESDAPAGWGLLIGPGVRELSAEQLASRYEVRSGIYSDGASSETLAAAKASEVTVVPGVGLAWAGLEDTYFLAAFIPHVELDRVAFVPRLQVAAAGGNRFDPVPAENLTPEQKALPRELALVAVARGGRLDGEAFLGGKDYDSLRSFGVGLERSVRFGWFGWFAKMFLRSLQWIYANVVANYGWAIVLLTILIRVVLLPFTHQSMVSAQKMQELNPKVQGIRQKYSGKLRDKKGAVNFENQRKMSEEINAVYKSAGVNPLGGCLPMFIQLPVLIAFYNLLANAIELRGAPWIAWIHDLSAQDPYYVLPIVMGAAQFAQQALAPPVGDPVQRKVFMILPVVFTVMFASAPSGLVLYWLVNNLLSLVQQSFYQRWKSRREQATA